MDGGGRGQWFAGEEGGEFGEDPGVADGAAGDPDGVDAGGAVHAEGVVGGEDVAGAEGRGGRELGMGIGYWGGGGIGNWNWIVEGSVARWRTAVASGLARAVENGGRQGACAGGGELFEEGPVGGAGVFLFDGAGVDGDGGELEGAGFVEDLVEGVGGLGGVVEGAAEFDGQRRAGDGVADAAHDGEGGFGVGEEIAAAAAAHDFADGAGEIQVDDVEAVLDEQHGGAGEFVGVGAHELAGDRVVLVAEDGPFFQAAAAAEEDLVEQGFGDGIGAAAAAGDGAHGHVGIAGEAGLHGGQGEGEGADVAGMDHGNESNRGREGGGIGELGIGDLEVDMKREEVGNGLGTKKLEEMARELQVVLDDGARQVTFKLGEQRGDF